MAVPKKRTGHSAQGKRRSNWKATKPTTTKCPNCGAVVLAHTVCTACGQYKGKVVSRKAEGFTEEVKEEKKAAKKSTKKAKTAEEVKVEAVEEIKEVVEEKAEEAKSEEQTQE
jgi:large subunit ribosomal protein L32